MKRNLQGHDITISTVGVKVKAFVPAPLPPDPPVQWSPKRLRLFDEAHHAPGKLEGVGDLLPETSLFLYPFDWSTKP